MSLTSRLLLPLAVAFAVLANALVPTPAAAAVSPPETVAKAAAAFGLDSYALQSAGNGRDLTRWLTAAVTLTGQDQSPRIVHLPSGQYTVTSSIKVSSGVYLVAEKDTVVTWSGGQGQLLRFPSAGKAGVYGGTWDGGTRKDSTLIAANRATVALQALTVRNASQHGIAGYNRASLTLRDVRATSNYNGVFLQNSTLNASGLHATLNRRNGVQLSQNSVGTIEASYLDRNGRAVKGSTTGKTGHGLGVAASQAIVTGTSLSGNKVCGTSLTDGARVELHSVTLNDNGRHGIGTTARTRAIVSDSVVRRNGYNGVLASGSGTQVELTRVGISDSAKYGLSVPSSGAASITETVIERSRISNISVSKNGRLTVGDNNTILSAKSHGIAVTGRSALHLDGEGNLIQGNKGNGLLISGSKTIGTLIARVQFTKNRKNGILVKSKAKLTMVPAGFSGNKGKQVLKQSGAKVVTRQLIAE